MKVGLITESLPAGELEHNRFLQVIEEAVAAEAAGFDFFGVPEQHFRSPISIYSAPAVIHSAIAARTSRIRIRPMIVVLPTHHPVFVAEYVASLDVISQGRVDFGTGRGNNEMLNEMLGVPWQDTVGRWRESLEMIVRMWAEEGEFSYDGTHFSVHPPIRVGPKPVQLPHPPIWFAAVSPQMSALAGELGIGLISLAGAVDWAQLRKRIDAYRKAAANPEPVPWQTQNRVCVFISGYCDEDATRAVADAGEGLLAYCLALVRGYGKTLESKGIHLDQSLVEANLSDVETMLRNEFVMLGDPDDCTRYLRKLAQHGADEVAISIEGVPHERIMNSIELLGRHVLPAVRDLAFV